MRAERGISLPVAGAPTLPSESDVENDVTFGGRVNCDQKGGGDQREVSKVCRLTQDSFGATGATCRFADKGPGRRRLYSELRARRKHALR